MTVRNFSTEFLDNLSLSSFYLLRGRKNFNLHLNYSEPSQRLFNAIGFESYITPQGRVQFTFDIPKTALGSAFVELSLVQESIFCAHDLGIAPKKMLLTAK